MKKTTLLLGLLYSVWSLGQTPKWTLGDRLIDFSGSNPTISTTYAHDEIENAAYDRNGNLVFYVADNKIYDASNLQKAGVHGLATVSHSALIPVPARCDEYYLIRGEGLPAKPGKIWWQRITVQGGTYTVSQAVAITNTNIHNEIPTFALTALDNVKNRRLLFCEEAVYEVTAAGINHLKTISGFHVTFSELEYFYDGGNYVFYCGDDFSHIFRYEISPQFNLISATTLTTLPNLLIATGLEVYNSGNNLLIATKNDLRVYNVVNNTMSVIPNSSSMGNTNIERAADGNFYGIHSSIINGNQIVRKLYRIDPFNMTISNMNIGLNWVSGYFWFRIPHQVDGDNLMQNSFMWDLWTSDGNGDIGDEPDVQSTNYWEGNVWNCTGTLGCTNPQNPDANHANYMTVKVENKGCTYSAPASVHLYWTRARTGEIWPDHWTNNPSNYLNGHLAGEEVTPASGLSIPALAPGASITLDVQWNPPYPVYFPANFGATTPNGKPMICFLSRIVAANDPMYTEYNGIKMSDYARDNNNVATRNAELVYTGFPIMIAPGTLPDVAMLTQDIHTLFLNASGADAVGELQIRNLGTNDLIMHGEIFLYLEDHLYAQWEANGAMGTGIEALGEGVFRITDGMQASLQNLNISAADEGNIGLQFFSSDPGLPDGTDFKYIVETVDMAGEVGSGYVFNILSGVAPEEGDKGKALVAGEYMNPEDVVKVFPNPTTGRVQVQRMLEDIVEVRVKNIEGKSVPVEVNAVENGFEVDLQHHPTGTYFIIVVTESGRTIAHKLLLAK